MSMIVKNEKKESHHRHAPTLLLSHISFFFLLNRIKREREKKIDDVCNPIIGIDAHAVRQ